MRKIRVTASSIRAIGIIPLSTLLEHIANKVFPTLGYHNQIYTSVDSLSAIFSSTAFNLSDAVPVADHETVESRAGLLARR